MPPAHARRTGLALVLLAGVILGVADGARAQTATPTRRPQGSAMSPYATTVTPRASAMSGDGQAPDPLERVNRKIYAFNQGLDRVLIRPLSVFWHHAAPRPIRQGIDNFLSNLGEPVVFVNDVLQGHPATAAGTATRFTANTIIGLLGIFDVTGATGLPHHDNGFGLTLGRWGVKSGPYIYLPVLGPSTIRDGIGQGVDVLANPLTYARNTGSGGLTTGLSLIGGLDARSEADSDLKALEALSTDPYAALRSFYLQNRQAQISGGKIDLNALPDFDDPDAPAPPAIGSPAIGSPAAGPVMTPTPPGAAALASQTVETPSPAAALPNTPADPAPPPAAPKGV